MYINNLKINGYGKLEQKEGKLNKGINIIKYIFIHKKKKCYLYIDIVDRCELLNYLLYSLHRIAE